MMVRWISSVPPAMEPAFDHTHRGRRRYPRQQLLRQRDDTAERKNRVSKTKLTTSRPERPSGLPTGSEADHDAAAESAPSGTARDGTDQAAAHAAGDPDAEDPIDRSAARDGQICMADVCVETPEDGWPISFDEVEQTADRPAGHTHPEPVTKPEPKLKPLPPPLDMCPDGRTLASYQREEYATWYCQATIPEPVAGRYHGPSPTPSTHPTGRSGPAGCRIRCMCGSGWFSTDRRPALKGVVVEIVWHDGFVVDRYNVHICVGEPHNVEYFSAAFP